MTLRIYPGAAGRFTLHEDDGVSERYRDGRYSRIPITYDDTTGAVTIGAREGKGYDGMAARRSFRIVWMDRGRALDLDGAADASAEWTGAAMTIARPAHAGR